MRRTRLALQNDSLGGGLVTERNGEFESSSYNVELERDRRSFHASASAYSRRAASAMARRLPMRSSSTVAAAFCSSAQRPCCLGTLERSAKQSCPLRALCSATTQHARCTQGKCHWRRLRISQSLIGESLKHQLDGDVCEHAWRLLRRRPKLHAKGTRCSSAKPQRIPGLRYARSRLTEPGRRRHRSRTVRVRSC